MNPMYVYAVPVNVCERDNPYNILRIDWAYRVRCRRCGQVSGSPMTHTRAMVKARQHLNWCPATGRQTHG